MNKNVFNIFASRETAPRRKIELYKPEYAEFFAYSRHLRFRQGVFTACFLLLCITDQLQGSAPGQIHGIILNFMGLVLCAVILNHDSKIQQKTYLLYASYGVWAALFSIGFLIKLHSVFGADAFDIFGWLTGKGGNPLAGSAEFIEWLLLAANIAAYGFLLLRTVMENVLARRLPRINWPFLAVWVLMLAGMFFSKNEALWPICFLLIFGCFYFTGYSRDEVTCLFNGMMNGIIAAFFLFFVFSAMFRAFDVTGYPGMYLSYERNALFHLYAHAAFLGKWYQFHKLESPFQWKVFAALGSCLVFGYGVITTVRPVICLMVFNTVVTLLFLLLQDRSKRIVKTVLRAAVLIAVSALMVPCVYKIMRHIPASFHTPLVFSGENRETKIGFWVSADDARYTEAGELKEELTGQLFSYQDEEKQEYKETQKQLRADTRKAYLRELNFPGHPSEESGFWITDWYYAVHSGNLFLHMAYTYGIPAGLLFLVFCILPLCFFLVRYYKRRSLEWWFYTGFLFLLTTLSYGFFDRNWNVGQLPFTLLFLVMHLVIQQSGNAGTKRDAEAYTPSEKELISYE